jgi:hypothetical protein
MGGAYGIVVKNNIIEVTVGIDAPLNLMSINELGQQDVIFSGFVKKGTYNFATKNRGIQWIMGSQGSWTDVLPIFVD